MPTYKALTLLSSFTIVSATIAALRTVKTNTDNPTMPLSISNCRNILCAEKVSVLEKAISTPRPYPHIGFLKNIEIPKGHIKVLPEKVVVFFPVKADNIDNINLLLVKRVDPRRSPTVTKARIKMNNFIEIILFSKLFLYKM